VESAKAQVVDEGCTVSAADRAVCVYFVLCVWVCMCVCVCVYCARPLYRTLYDIDVPPL
jgi:hypothetical protein